MQLVFGLPITAEALTGRFRTSHRARDRLGIEADVAVFRGDWSCFRRAACRTGQAIERLFRLAETILFPAYQSASGAPGGPTGVIPGEHAHMHPLIAALAGAKAEAEPRACPNTVETFLLFMLRRKLKEESVLYSRYDRIFAGQRVRLLRAQAWWTRTSGWQTTI